jgi:probable F420-dependent oxidoreductase
MTDASELRLAILTPVLTMMPGAHARWEESGTIEDVARIAVAADALGYDHLTCSEHFAVPRSQAIRRGGTYWDPLSTFGYLAAATTRIRMATNVLVLGYHHPLEIAKRYGTLDRVSGGRLVLGVGVGTLKEEFDLLGAPYDDRGDRADDALRALRASLSVTEPTYEGPYYEYRDLVVAPSATQEHVPIWVGGRTARSLRRAAELADGWCPFGVSSGQAGDWLRRTEVPLGFEVRLSPENPLDPAAESALTTDVLSSLALAGATIVEARVVHQSLEHYLEQIEALAALGSLSAGRPETGREEIRAEVT